MNTSSANLYVDITLGITGFLLLLIYFINTEEYAVFRLVYYYYLIAAPCFGLLKLSEITLFAKSNIDLSQISLAESDTERSINRKSEIIILFQMLLVSLLIILPTLIELVIGAMSIITKYALTENVSVNDLYVIHFTTAFLAVVPLCLKEIKDSSPDNILDNAQKTYIYFWTVLFTLVGIAINTLVLISGGLIGLNICNNHLISQ